MEIGSGWMLTAGLVLAMAAVVQAIACRWSGSLLALLIPGILLLALAAGDIQWHRPSAGTVAVMVDLSPSTRGAAYRDPAWLTTRIHQLLSDTSRQLIFFSDDNRPVAKLPDTPLADLSSDQTQFHPPAGVSAILLFSDGQFTLPAAAPPVYAVIDPQLEQVASQDSSVVDLQLRNDHALATVRGNASLAGGPWAGLDDPLSDTSPSLRHFSRTATEKRITARLDVHDLWPENDGLSAIEPEPWATQRWWIGADAPPGWVAISSAEIPPDPAAWLTPSVILLKDISPAEVSIIQLDRLEQYVRDLGGAVILSGTRPAALSRLSPLSDDPPHPAHRWIFLMDASGSMNEGTDGTTRWRQAGVALQSALRQVADNDRVDVAGFAENLRWWVRDAAAQTLRNRSWPPADIWPTGPTNLEAALSDAIDSVTSVDTLPTELMILTDAEADLSNPDSLADRMRQRHIRFWVVAGGHGPALAALSRLAAQTGGAARENQSMAQWSLAMRQLADAARGSRERRTPAMIRFTGPLASLPSREIAPWREAWVKQRATPLSDRRSGNGLSPEIARWQYGNGLSVAANFALNDAEIEAIVRQIAIRPTDPRLKVTFTRRPETFNVRIDAVDADHWLNGLNLTLSMQTMDRPDAPADIHSIPQTAPGLYELTLPTPRRDVMASVMYGPQVMDRAILSGRYAPEFDGIGLNRDRLTELADRTGGAIVTPQDDRAIAIHQPRRNVSLSPWLAMAGAVLLAGVLVRWRTRDTVRI